MMILRILKYLFFSMISLLVITLAIVYINLDYKMYPLKANQELYSKNIWEIDTDSLAEELLKKGFVNISEYKGGMKEYNDKSSA